MSRFVDVQPWDATDEEYFAAVGSSTICRALGNDGPGETTSKIGRALHCAVLEPDQLEQRYACPPEDCRVGSGTGQRSRLAEWEASKAVGKTVLTPSEWAEVLAMRDALEGRKILGWLRKSGVQFERSFRATDSITGLTIRVRPDALLGTACQDLKTSESPSFHGFKRAIESYLYAVQAALYWDVLGLDSWHWLVVGRKTHRTALYRCPEKWIDAGRRLYSAGLALISAAGTKRPRAYWEDRPLEIDPPPQWVLDEILIHEQHAEKAIDEVIRRSA